MADSKLSEIVSRTREYMTSPAGRRAWRENHLAHGFSVQKNLVAAIQTANPRMKLVRYEDFEVIMSALALEVAA